MLTCCVVMPTISTNENASSPVSWVRYRTEMLNDGEMAVVLGTGLYQKVKPNRSRTATR